MSISFHDASVGSYLQVLQAIAGVLDKGASHAAEAGLDPQEIVMKAQPGRSKTAFSQNASGIATNPITNSRNTAGPSALSFDARARPHTAQRSTTFR